MEEGGSKGVKNPETDFGGKDGKATQMGFWEDLQG